MTTLAYCALHNHASSESSDHEPTEHDYHWLGYDANVRINNMSASGLPEGLGGSCPSHLRISLIRLGLGMGSYTDVNVSVAICEAT